MKLHADYLPVHITTHCTLRCRDCANAIPQFQPPRHSDVITIIHTLERLFQIFETTSELRLAGGEAFLHPDIAALIVEALRYQPHFNKLVVATNATYVPQESVLRACAAAGDVFQVNIDDYGSLSEKLPDLLDALDRYGIGYVVHSYHDEEQYCGGWIDFGMDFTYKGYSDEQLHRVFDACRKNYYIFDGRMYACCPAAAAYELGLFRTEENAVVNLLEYDVNQRHPPIKEKIYIINIISQIETMMSQPCAVCHYCNGFDTENGVRIHAAIQLE